ncbi:MULTISPECIES: hypothetical protein [Xanthomonas]|uniref:Uncharacterized protein n=1 Tax=Xanthomonas cucurbitae TaxID=56453 RepID=A0ABY7YCD9_9XANT|nr:hypothetical protein [Xanthomonas cucurbitae]WDM67626.1 hypothetical protein K6981_19670 [Xanthomonas cucurbitae]WDM71502.1 hypothetical protein K6978_19635 [Xanthomonas cucurbitae]WDM75347.1 hypothetical protein K6982_18775 [Xanthomonas cucurbitae]
MQEEVIDKSWESGEGRHHAAMSAKRVVLACDMRYRMVNEDGMAAARGIGIHWHSVLNLRRHRHGRCACNGAALA